MEQVFHAVAEPTRRELIASLHARPAQSLGELAAPLAMSRQAVSKHLDVLDRAGLIRVEWQGRRKLHRLDPEPLREVEDWLAPFSAAWDRRLERLERHLKEGS